MVAVAGAAPINGTAGGMADPGALVAGAAAASGRTPLAASEYFAAAKAIVPPAWPGAAGDTVSRTAVGGSHVWSLHVWKPMTASRGAATSGDLSASSRTIGPSTAPASTSSACVVGVTLVTRARTIDDVAAVPEETIVGFPWPTAVLAVSAGW